MNTIHAHAAASPAEQVRAQRDAFLGRLFDRLREDAIDETTADVAEALAYMAGPRGDATALASVVADAAKRRFGHDLDDGQIEAALDRLAKAGLVTLEDQFGVPVARLWPAPPVAGIRQDQDEGAAPTATQPKPRASRAAGRLAPGQMRRPSWIEQAPHDEGEDFTKTRIEWVRGLAEAAGLRPLGVAFRDVCGQVEGHLNRKTRLAKVGAEAIAEAADLSRNWVDKMLAAAETAGVLNVIRHGRGRGSTREFRIVPVRLWPDAVWRKPARKAGREDE